MRRPLLAIAIVGLSLGCGVSDEGGAEPPSACAAAARAHGAAFVCRVVSFSPGEGAGFGQDAMPDIVLGPPEGAGQHAGSLDVLSLGAAGEIVVEMGETIADGPGVDLLVFENAFLVEYAEGVRFSEPGEVAVSEDGETFVTFPCGGGEAEPHEGCAGVEPVLAAPGNGLDPLDPEVAGGDRFDLADVGVAQARFVRIRDVSGKMTGTNSGFDLDALAVINPAP